MNNEQLPPPTLGGAERLSHKVYKSYKSHKPYKTYKPSSPPWGIEGGSFGGPEGASWLENEELPRVREAIAEARDKGDLSENFEYHAAKREQGRLLGRIRFKQRVLEHARVIDTTRLNSDNVGLLSKVKITNLASNASMSYTIVSPHEANMSEGKISIKSPIAQALMGHKAGDTVEVTVPAGKLRLRIDSVAL